MTASELVQFIERHRWPLSSEKRLQELFVDTLRAAGHAALREVRLDDESIIDVMVESIGVELKIKGQRRAIYRQCERYCHFDEVQALVLGTSVSMGMPDTINGKPVFVASLSRGWL